MKEYIAKVAEGENLTEEEAKKAMDIMLSGDATQAQIAAFLALTIHRLDSRRYRGA